jgi:hypothetical protein
MTSRSALRAYGISLAAVGITKPVELDELRRLLATAKAPAPRP